MTTTDPHKTPPARATLPRTARVRDRRDFQQVFARRCRRSDRLMVLYVAPNAGRGARLGIAAGRRLGNAVRRNRIKRLVREAFRRIRTRLPSDLDYVVVPHPGPEPTVEQLQNSLGNLARALEPRARKLDDARTGES